LYAKLSSYLKEYNKGKNYTFILGYQKGGGILFANDSLDITREVLDGLNKEFESK
jgi:outer membrane protein